MGYTYYNPLKVWLDPASIADVVSYMQKYLSENPIKDTEEINQIIADYIAAHPEIIGGVQSVNGETGVVVLTASDINTTGQTTIQEVLTSLSSQISDIAQAVASIETTLGLNNLYDNYIANTTGNITELTVDDGEIKFKANSRSSTISIYTTTIPFSQTCFEAGKSFDIKFESSIPDATIQLYYKITSNVQILSNTAGEYTVTIPDGSVGVIFRVQVPASASGYNSISIKVYEHRTQTIITTLDNLTSDIVFLKTLSNETNAYYPSSESTVSDLLNIEKNICVVHDNFSRADNATDIGSNGSISGYDMGFTDMASSATESQNIKVGISNNTAVATNPNNVTNAKRFKLHEADITSKISITFGSKGLIIISPLDTDNYISVELTPNAVSVSGIGSVICSSASVTHNANYHSADVYTFRNRIEVYIAGRMLISTNAVPVNKLVGIGFTSDDINTISYSNVDIFTQTENVFINIDECVEKCQTVSQELIGSIQQTGNYGVTFSADHTYFSDKALRFEQRRADSQGGTYRSELTPPNGRPRNYNLQTLILDYDIYFPSDYAYDSAQEVLWQQHHTPDSVNPDAMYPNIAFRTYQGKMQVSVRGFARKATSADDATETLFDLGNVVTETWKHMTVFIREGYLAEQLPCVAIWIDGELKLLTRIPNAYNTKMGSYFKMGMYKAIWASMDTENTSRTVYYDNIKIWH